MTRIAVFAIALIATFGSVSTADAWGSRSTGIAGSAEPNQGITAPDTRGVSGSAEPNAG